ncbi:nucleotide-diphospho-sugar transferase [Paraphoma chrysanthemicola]|nr:nucleotide-diphospho-sugar transferase [Paraphoma chrysanthemicola]
MTSSSRCPYLIACRRTRTNVATGLALAIISLLSISLDRVTALRASLANSNDEVKMSWTDFAYVQYVTDDEYLCNSVMILESLHRLAAKADRIMMYPDSWKAPDISVHQSGQGTKGRLLAIARDVFGTKLVPIKLQTLPKGDPTWKDSYTKLLAFNQTQYKRVLSLDSDAIVQDHMDELFLSPSSPVAMPRAYWLDQPFLSSQLLLLEPSQREWDRVNNYMEQRNPGFDMDILNTLYKESCLVLPHRRYNLVSGELRRKNHSQYLGSNEVWNGSRILEEAKYIHFSDWPVPKPWLVVPEEVKANSQPECVAGLNGKDDDCTDRDLWLGLYDDFSSRREVVCKSAPHVGPRKR